MLNPWRLCFYWLSFGIFCSDYYLEIPCKLNIGTNNKKIIKEGTVRYIIGELKNESKQITVCPCCGAKINCGGKNYAF